MRARLAFFALLFATPLALADDAPVDGGRFSMTPTANGFMRLDKQTGAVSLCVVNGGSAECRAAADDRAALNDEIDRLAKENTALEQRLAETRRPSPLNSLPSKEDMGRALDYAEDFMRRMMRLMREDDKSGREKI
jgi:cell division protein FtsB